MNAPANIDGNVLNYVLKYELLTTHIDDLEQMSYTTYGIRVKDDSGNSLFEYTDISTSKEFVQSFLDLVKDRDVSAVHIPDLLEDFMD